MIRHAATEHDKAVFDQWLKRISGADSYFCCGGTLELVDRPLTLYYKSAPTGKNNWIDFREMAELSATDRQAAIDNLLQTCVPAPHGRDDETVLDESYRLARELSQNEFALSIDILSEAGRDILSSISALTVGRFEEYPEPDSLIMVPRLYKLNAYGKNGFFKSHRDTPKGNHHIGTLMIALPVAYQGGALRVSHNGNEILFDWHDQCSKGVQVSQEPDAKLKMSLPWAFLFSDVEHEVLPVESGTRVTIAYDIFSSSQTGVMNDIAGPLVSNMDITTFPLYQDFVTALRDPLFLTKGAEVAIALSHSYPMARGGTKLSNKEFAAGLKGIDAIVYRAMKAAGFDVSLKAVMPKRTSYYYSDSEDKENSDIPKDGYDPVMSSDDILVTSNIFMYTTQTELSTEDDEHGDLLKQEFKAYPSPQLMWVKKPENTFTNVGAYIHYSNEHSVKFFYAAAAFVLRIPPFGEGYRAFP